MLFVATTTRATFDLFALAEEPFLSWGKKSLEAICLNAVQTYTVILLPDDIGLFVIVTVLTFSAFTWLSLE